MHALARLEVSSSSSNAHSRLAPIDKLFVRLGRQSSSSIDPERLDDLATHQRRFARLSTPLSSALSSESPAPSLFLPGAVPDSSPAAVRSLYDARATSLVLIVFAVARALCFRRHGIDFLASFRLSALRTSSLQITLWRLVSPFSCLAHMT